MSLLPFNSLVCWQITLTLLHVSWIGLIMGLIAAFFNRLLRDRAAQSSRLFPGAAASQFSEVSRGADGTRSVPATLNANRRYWVNFISLLLFAASLPVTFVVVRSMTGEVPAAFGNAETLVAEQASSTPSIVEEPTFSRPPQDDEAFAPVPRQGLSTAAEIPAAAPSPTVIPSSLSLWERLHSISRTAAPFVVILYGIGVALMFVKLAFSVRVSRRLRSGSRPISDAHILARMAEQAKKLSLRIMPVIACCEQTAVPIVVGVLRPMILIPAAMVNGLTIEQLEFVLTHELAHLRRRDHWMIVVQRVLEAILFFHPVTWYLSHRIHDDRETSCDDLVLSMGGDRLQYAQSLLRVAELRLAGQSHQNHIALAADGQRPSKLRQRIARLLGESEGDSVRVSSVWLVVILAGFFATAILSMNILTRPILAAAQDTESQEAKKERSEALDQEAVLQLAGKVYDRFSAINTAHVRFRFSIPNGTIRKGLTLEKVRTLLKENDLASKPDNLRKLLVSIFVDEETVPDKPWDDIELFRDGKGSSRRVRITTSSSNHGPDYWVGGGNGSLHWDAQNFQMNIPSELDVKLNDKLTTFLMSFLTSPNRLFLYLKQSQAEEVYRERDEIVLQYPGRYSDVEIVRLDATAGYLNSFGRYHHYGMIPSIVQQETLEFGWRQLDDEIWLPTVVAQLGYRYGELDNCQFTVIDHAIFNQPLPDGIFQLGAPAGAVISDKRSGLHQKYTINRDVFDASSDEQLAAAREPLSEKLTDIEVSGVAVATSLYRIDDGVALKRIGPSFQLARSYVSRMLGNRSVDSLRGISRLLRQNGTGVELQHAEEGRAITAKELATFLKIADSAEIDGDEDLLELAIPGDFVFREGANKVDLIRNLQEIVTNEAQTPVTVEFRDAERTVYRATGEIKLKLRNGYSGIQMNAGPFGHFSDRINTGNLNSFLQKLSTYIDSRVVNAVEPTSAQLKWSERFYRIDPTKPTELVRIDPAVVLEQITEQTGIRFTEEKQVVPVLFIERVKEERSTVDAGKPLSGEKSNHVAIPEQHVVKPTIEFIRTDGDDLPIADGQAKVTGEAKLPDTMGKAAIWSDGTGYLKGFADDTIADADLPDAGPPDMEPEKRIQNQTPAEKVYTAPPKDALLKILGTNFDLNAFRKSTAGLQYTSIGPIPDEEWEPFALEEAYDIVLTGMKENFGRIKTWSGECQETIVRRDDAAMVEESNLVRFAWDVPTSKGGAVQTASTYRRCPVAEFDTQKPIAVDRLAPSDEATDAATQFHTYSIFHASFFFGRQNKLHWNHFASYLKHFEDTETPESERFVVAYRAKDQSSGMWRIDTVYRGIQDKLLVSQIISKSHGFNVLRETRVFLLPDGKAFFFDEVLQSYLQTDGAFVPSERLERTFGPRTEDLQRLHLQRITESIVNQPLEPLPVLTPPPANPPRVFPVDGESFPQTYFEDREHPAS